jgi:hypothetical protein
MSNGGTLSADRKESETSVLPRCYMIVRGKPNKVPRHSPLTSHLSLLTSYPLSLTPNS